MAGVPKLNQDLIYYEIGRRHDTAVAAMSRPRNPVIVDSGFETAVSEAEALRDFAREHTGLTMTFARTNLIGVVERIARGLACASLYEKVDSECLFAGPRKAVMLLKHQCLDTPLHENVVFIPRGNTRFDENIFVVLASAIAGEGGIPATNSLSADDPMKSMSLPTVDSKRFPKACFNALRVLGANFEASNAGDQFALGFTQGIHSAMNVVPHSYEGSIMHEILGQTSYSVPFGGIRLDHSSYFGLPKHPDDLVSFHGNVDGIALKTAALVAHCDPCVQVNGEWFPTILGDGAMSAVRDAELITTSGKRADRNWGRLRQVFPSFSRIYCAALTKLFAFPPSDSGADILFNHTIDSIEEVKNSVPLYYGSFAPFFFIEPTSLVDTDFVGSIAEREGFASLAGGGQDVHARNAWEHITVASSSRRSVTHWEVKMRSARTALFLAHFAGNLRSCLTSIRIHEINANATMRAHSGHPRIGEWSREDSTLGDCLWSHSHSCLPAPSEFVLLAPYMCISVRHFDTTIDKDNLPLMRRVPLPHEFAETKIKIVASVPQWICPGRAESPTRDMDLRPSNAVAQISKACTSSVRDQSRKRSRASAELSDGEARE
ncbi:hypothetical protein PYCC9005_005473 [Savitreella phatthalungensis]